MAIDLNTMGIGRNGNGQFYKELQGNILKPHARDFATLIFLRISEDRKAAKEAIRELNVTSAKEQFKQIEKYKRTHESRPFFNFFLSASGYRALGFRRDQIPEDEKFLAGMKESRRALDDPPVESWDKSYQKEVHAMVLVADDDEQRLINEYRKIVKAWKDMGAFEILTIERGKRLMDQNGNSIEHFGYRDGVSQPLFLQDDIDDYIKEVGVTRWDPSAPLSLVLVKDPNGQHEDSFGSYCVFRKLEQNVRAAKEMEEALGEKLTRMSDETEDDTNDRAGASVVGRFEDGTPIVDEHKSQWGIAPPCAKGPNNFNYDEDTTERKCPLRAHTRIVNPRTDDEKRHRIARRGMPYGNQVVLPGDAVAEELPSGGVGLLFICFQRNIKDQFEYQQKKIVESYERKLPMIWNKPKTVTVSVPDFITPKGGEYFFAPSMSFLKNI